MRRSKNIPQLKLGFWKQKALFYFADAQGLNEAIINSKFSEADLQAKMGHGYRTIGDLLEGRGVGIYSASFVESALTRVEERRGSQPYGHHDTASGTANGEIEINPELRHFFTNVKCDVGRMLREMSDRNRRDGEGLHLHSAFTCLEDIQKESAKPLRQRDLKRVISCWKRIMDVTEKFDLFSRYRGNKEMKKQVVEFLNGLR
jgi:hypothetical protein